MRGPCAYPGVTADVVIEISFIICTHEKRTIPPPMETDSGSIECSCCMNFQLRQKLEAPDPPLLPAILCVEYPMLH